MKNAKILIVDDNDVNRILLQHTFEDEEYEIFESESGYEALEIVKNKAIDIILLDVMMPGMDGYETCQRIKTNPQSHDIPIIFITALNDKESKLKGLNLGGVDFISKPFDMFEVKLRIKQHLKIRQLYLSLRKQSLKTSKDLLIARQVQMGLLPQNNVSFNEDIFFSYEYLPCDSLGGDFLDYIKIDEEHYFFYLADISGHGVPSALVTMFVKQFFESYLSNSNEIAPHIAIGKLNEAMLNLNFHDRYLTLFTGLLNIQTKELRWASAGPNTPPLLIKEDSIDVLDNRSLAVGWLPDIVWEEKKLTLPRNSSLLLYSDAATEVKNDFDEQLGVDGFKKLIDKSEFGEYQEFVELVNELLDYSDDIGFDDDLTFVSLRVRK
ncbi:MAG: response regulator [Candidatus Cloacimonadota bacterium]|nr:response regulator [Candidatus Cloacimonadota bacterium]